jgi:hypothetical protein
MTWRAVEAVGSRRFKGLAWCTQLSWCHDPTCRTAKVRAAVHAVKSQKMPASASPP